MDLGEQALPSITVSVRSSDGETTEVDSDDPPAGLGRFDPRRRR